MWDRADAQWKAQGKHCAAMSCSDKECVWVLLFYYQQQWRMVRLTVTDKNGQTQDVYIKSKDHRIPEFLQSYSHAVCELEKISYCWWSSWKQTCKYLTCFRMLEANI